MKPRISKEELERLCVAAERVLATMERGTTSEAYWQCPLDLRDARAEIERLQCGLRDLEVLLLQSDQEVLPDHPATVKRHSFAVVDYLMILAFLRGLVASEAPPQPPPPGPQRRLDTTP